MKKNAVHLSLGFQLLAFLISSPMLAQAASPESIPAESMPSEAVPESAPQNYGELLFFPERQARPAEDRHLVTAGQQVGLCLRLFSNSAPFIDRIKNQAIEYQLVLEDSQVPPNQILISLTNEKVDQGILEENARGCYAATFQIPSAADPGTYQFADLLFRSKDGIYYSLRDYLFGFSKVEELEVKNEHPSAAGPDLVAIRNLDPPFRNFRGNNKVLKIRVRQNFFFKGENSPVDPQSLKIFYRLWKDGLSAGFHEASCKQMGKKSGSFKCHVDLSRPQPIWNLRKLSLELNSIYIKDFDENLSVFQSPELLREKTCSGTIKFEFAGQKKKQQPKKTKLKLDKSNDMY